MRITEFDWIKRSLESLELNFGTERNKVSTDKRFNLGLKDSLGLIMFWALLGQAVCSAASKVPRHGIG